MPQGQEFFTRRPDAEPATLGSIINQVVTQRAIRRAKSSRIKSFLPGGKESIEAILSTNREAFRTAFPVIAGSEYEERLLDITEVRPVTYATMRRTERRRIGIGQGWMISKLAEAGQNRRNYESATLSVVPGVDTHLYQYRGERRFYVERSLARAMDSEDPEEQLQAVVNLTEALTIANLKLLSDEVVVTDSKAVRQHVAADMRELLDEQPIPDRSRRSIYMSYLAIGKTITQKGGLTVVYMGKKRAEEEQPDFATDSNLDGLVLLYLATKVLGEAGHIYRNKGLTTSRVNEEVRDEVRQEVERKYNLGSKSRLFSNDEELFLTYIMGELPQTVRELTAK